MITMLPPYLRRRLGLRARSTIAYDDLVRVRFGERAYMLTNIADVRHVLVGNAANYVKSAELSGEQGKRRAGSGLLTASGAAHQRQRRLMQPLFHQRVMDGFAAVIADRTQRALDGWRGRREIDIAREMADLSMSILMGMLFGIDFEDDGRLAEAIRARRRYTEYVYHSRLPFRVHLPTRAVREHVEAIAVLDEILHAAIASRRARASIDGADMTSLLMGATYSDGSCMTDRQVRDELLTLTSTGHETIGDGLAWAWYLIGLHADVEQRLTEEARQVLGARAPEASDLPKLRYTSMVLSETLRLYPPTWIFVRVPLADDRLPSGHEVRAGTTLYLCPYVLHRHPVHFPGPERFDPGRFDQASVEARPKGAYIPFGSGPHTCIGEAFARLEGVLVLAHLAARLRFELSAEPVPKATITLTPKSGIRMRVVERA